MKCLNVSFGGRVVAFIGVAAATSLATNTVVAQDVDYKGKTIRMIIGSGTGGGYDAYGRLLAANMPRHIPGRPTMIVQNMPGAGALVLANHLGNIAVGDTNVIGGINPAVSIYPVFKPENAKYDARKFGWIGNLMADTFVAVAWSDSPIKSFKDIFETEFVIGGSGGASTEYPPLINGLLGTKYKMVAGYKGTNQSMLAMERGEVQGVGGTTWSSLKAQSRQLIKDKKIRVIVQYSKMRNPELLDVPTIFEFARNDEERQIMDAAFAYQSVGRAYITPPGVPPAVLATFRKAFDMTVTDEAFIADSAKRGIQVQPVSGAEIEKIVEAVGATPPAIVEKVNALKSSK